MSNVSWLGAAMAATLVLCAVEASARPCFRVTRANLIPCAEQASLERQAGSAAVRAAEGRVQATDPWLPSRPELEVSGSRRSGPPDREAFNWSVSLGVELELAGQRSLRREAARAERDAQKLAVLGLERSLAAEALRRYFDALAARESAAIWRQRASSFERIWNVARAAAERGAASGVEADVAEAAYLSAAKRALDAARDERLAELELSALLGLASGQRVEVEGRLEPLVAASSVRGDRAAPEAPDALGLEAERRAQIARASAYRRARVPNPTLSLFAQRDGFDESVLGVGVGIPLPLPEPLGNMHSGEIDESEALAQRAGLLAERARRDANAALARALANYASALDSSRLYGADRVARAAASLANVTAELEAGRLPIREALITGEALLDVLLGAVEARRALCLASVDVVVRAGLPLERGQP